MWISTDQCCILLCCELGTPEIPLSLSTLLRLHLNLVQVGGVFCHGDVFLYGFALHFAAASSGYMKVYQFKSSNIRTWWSWCRLDPKLVLHWFDHSEPSKFIHPTMMRCISHCPDALSSTPTACTLTIQVSQMLVKLQKMLLLSWLFDAFCKWWQWVTLGSASQQNLGPVSHLFLFARHAPTGPETIALALVFPVMTWEGCRFSQGSRHNSKKAPGDATPVSDPVSLFWDF